MTTETANLINKLNSRGVAAPIVVDMTINQVLNQLDASGGGLEDYLGEVSMPWKRLLFSLAVDSDEVILNQTSTKGWTAETIGKFNSLFREKVLPAVEQKFQL